MNKIEASSQKNTEGKLGQEAKVTVGFQDEWEKTEERKKDHLHLQVISERPKSTFSKARPKRTKKLHLMLSFLLKKNRKNARAE